MSLGILHLVSSGSGSGCWHHGHEFSRSNYNEICGHYLQLQINTLIDFPLSLSLLKHRLHMRQYDRLTVYVSPLGANFFGHHCYIILWSLLPIYLVKFTANLRLWFISYLLVFRTKLNIVWLSPNLFVVKLFESRKGIKTCRDLLITLPLITRIVKILP